MLRQSILADTFAVVGLVLAAAAGVHYDGLWGGAAALSAALLLFSMIHWLAMIHTVLLVSPRDNPTQHVLK